VEETRLSNHINIQMSTSTPTPTSYPTPDPWAENGEYTDILVGSLYAGVFLAYSFGLIIATRRDPGSTVSGLGQVARATWATSVLNDPASSTMAAQTLRNIIQGVKDLSSSTIAVGFGIFTYIVSNVSGSTYDNQYRPNFYHNCLYSYIANSISQRLEDCSGSCHDYNILSLFRSMHTLSGTLSVHHAVTCISQRCEGKGCH
jgi:hypothetical protein